VIVQGRQFRYVGIGSSLRQRITQRLIRRDSSVTTGVSAVSLNLDLVSDVLWWEAGEFSDPIALEAAERIAFDALEPVLRSRGAVREAERALADDDAFRTRMHRLLTAEPSGRLTLPSFDSMVERVRVEHRGRVPGRRGSVAAPAGGGRIIAWSVHRRRRWQLRVCSRRQQHRHRNQRWLHDPCRRCERQERLLLGRGPVLAAMSRMGPSFRNRIPCK
jgi:hypothetical protein